MSSINSAIKKQLAFKRYVHNSFNKIYMKPDIALFTPSQIVSETTAEIARLTFNILYKPRYEINQVFANFMNDTVRSLKESHLSLIKTTNRTLFDLSQNILNSLYDIYNVDIPESKLNNLSTNVDSFYTSINTACECNSIENETLSNLNQDKNKLDKADIQFIITFLLTLFTIFYQIYSDINDTKFKNQLLDKLESIHSSIQDISE